MSTTCCTRTRTPWAADRNLLLHQKLAPSCTIPLLNTTPALQQSSLSPTAPWPAAPLCLCFSKGRSRGATSRRRLSCAVLNNLLVRRSVWLTSEETSRRLPDLSRSLCNFVRLHEEHAFHLFLLRTTTTTLCGSCVMPAAFMPQQLLPHDAPQFSFFS